MSLDRKRTVYFIWSGDDIHIGYTENFNELVDSYKKDVDMMVLGACCIDMYEYRAEQMFERIYNRYADDEQYDDMYHFQVESESRFMQMCFNMFAGEKVPTYMDGLRNAVKHGVITAVGRFEDVREYDRDSLIAFYDEHYFYVRLDRSLRIIQDRYGLDRSLTKHMLGKQLRQSRIIASTDSNDTTMSIRPPWSNRLTRFVRMDKQLVFIGSDPRLECDGTMASIERINSGEGHADDAEPIPTPQNVIAAEYVSKLAEAIADDVITLVDKNEDNHGVSDIDGWYDDFSVWIIPPVVNGKLKQRSEMLGKLSANAINKALKISDVIITGQAGRNTTVAFNPVTGKQHATIQFLKSDIMSKRA